MNWCRNYVKFDKEEARYFFLEYEKQPHLEFSVNISENGMISISFLTPHTEPKEKMQEIAQHTDFIWKAVYEDGDFRYYAGGNGNVIEIPMCRYSISADYEVKILFTDEAYETYLRNLTDKERNMVMYLFAQCKLEHLPHVLNAVRQNPENPREFSIKFLLYDEYSTYRAEDIVRLSDRDVGNSFMISSDKFIPEINQVNEQDAQSIDEFDVHSIGKTVFDFEIVSRYITIHSISENEAFPEEIGRFEFAEGLYEVTVELHEKLNERSFCSYHSKDNRSLAEYMDDLQKKGCLDENTSYVLEDGILSVDGIYICVCSGKNKTEAEQYVRNNIYYRTGANLLSLPFKPVCKVTTINPAVADHNGEPYDFDKEI